MEHVRGDLIKLTLAGQFDVIVHGCNCFNTMGAGIAKSIARNFPEALLADRATPKGDRSKLGTLSVATAQRSGRTLTIVNAYTQFDWRGRGRKVSYEAIARCFGRIAGQFGGLRIGYPMIGAGLAGGDWAEIAPIIDRAMAGCDHKLVVFDG